jgi:hypothetical protein
MGKHGQLKGDMPNASCFSNVILSEERSLVCVVVHNGLLGHVPDAMRSAQIMGVGG